MKNKTIAPEEKIEFRATVRIGKKIYGLGYNAVEEFPLTEKSIKRIWKALTASMNEKLRENGKIIKE